MILTMLILIVDSIFQGDWWWPRAKTSEEDDCEVILFVFGFFVCDSVIMILCLFAILVWCLSFVLSCHWIFLCGSGHVYFKYLHFQQLFVNEPKLYQFQIENPCNNFCRGAGHIIPLSYIFSIATTWITFSLIQHLNFTSGDTSASEYVYISDEKGKVKWRNNRTNVTASSFKCEH